MGINNFEAIVVAVTATCAKILQRRLAMRLVSSHGRKSLMLKLGNCKPVEGG